MQLVCRHFLWVRSSELVLLFYFALRECVVNIVWRFYLSFGVLDYFLLSSGSSTPTLRCQMANEIIMIVSVHVLVRLTPNIPLTRTKLSLFHFSEPTHFPLFFSIPEYLHLLYSFPEVATFSRSFVLRCFLQLIQTFSNPPFPRPTLVLRRTASSSSRMPTILWNGWSKGSSRFSGPQPGLLWRGFNAF